MTIPNPPDEDDRSAGELEASSDLPPETIEKLARGEQAAARGARMGALLVIALGVLCVVAGLGGLAVATQLDAKLTSMGIKLTTTSSGLIIVALGVALHYASRPKIRISPRAGRGPR